MMDSGTTPRDSSKLRVKGLLKALLVQHKYGRTNYIYHMNMNNVSNARYKRELERKIRTQIEGNVSRFEPLLYAPVFNGRISIMSTQDLPQRDLY